MPSAWPRAPSRAWRCHNGSRADDYAGPGIENPHPFAAARRPDVHHLPRRQPGRRGQGCRATSRRRPRSATTRAPGRSDRTAYFNRLTLAGIDKFPNYMVGGQTYTALDYLQFINPGDLRVVTQGARCGQCHAGHAECVAHEPAGDRGRASSRAPCTPPAVRQRGARERRALPGHGRRPGLPRRHGSGLRAWPGRHRRGRAPDRVPGLQRLRQAAAADNLFNNDALPRGRARRRPERGRLGDHGLAAREPVPRAGRVHLRRLPPGQRGGEQPLRRLPLVGLHRLPHALQPRRPQPAASDPNVDEDRAAGPGPDPRARARALRAAPDPQRRAGRCRAASTSRASTTTPAPAATRARTAR